MVLGRSAAAWHYVRNEYILLVHTGIEIDSPPEVGAELLRVHTSPTPTEMPPDDPPAPAEHLPLTPVAFDILLSLMGGEAHGYAIMRSVEARSGGTTSLHAGTLYRALSRLVDADLIEELPEAPEEGADRRRRYYRITGLGEKVAAAEARRLEGQLGAARAHGLLGSA